MGEEGVWEREGERGAEGVSMEGEMRVGEG